MDGPSVHHTRSKKLDYLFETDFMIIVYFNSLIVGVQLKRKQAIKNTRPYYPYIIYNFFFLRTPAYMEDF